MKDDNTLESLIENIERNKELEPEIQNISNIIPLSYKNLDKYMELSEPINDYILSNSNRIFADGNASITIPDEVKFKIVDNKTPVVYDNGEKHIF